MSAHSRLLVRALEYCPEYRGGGCNPLWTVSSGLACAVPCAAAQGDPSLSLATVKLYLKHSHTFFLITELNIYCRPHLSVPDLAEVVQQLPQLQYLHVWNLADGSDDELLDIVLSSRFLEHLMFSAFNSSSTNDLLDAGVPTYRSARFEVGVMTRHHKEKMRLGAIWRLCVGALDKKIPASDAVAAGAIEHLVQAVLPAIRGRRSDRDGDGGQLPLIARYSDQFELWHRALLCLATLFRDHADSQVTLSDETVKHLEPLLTNIAVFNVESDAVLEMMARLLAYAGHFPAPLNLLCGDDSSGGIDQHAVLAVAARDILPHVASAAGNIIFLLVVACRSPTRVAEISKHIVADWNVLPVVARTLTVEQIGCCALLRYLLPHCFDDVVSFEEGRLISQLCALATTPAPTRDAADTLAAMLTAPQHAPRRWERPLAIMSSCDLPEKLVRSLMESPPSASESATEARDAQVALLNHVLIAEVIVLGESVRYGRFPRPDTLHDDTAKMNAALSGLSSAERNWFAEQKHFVCWTQLLAIAVEKPTVFDELIEFDRQRLERVPRVGSPVKISLTVLEFVALVETHLRTKRPLDYPAVAAAAAAAKID